MNTSMLPAPEPYACALVIIIAMSAAGTVHTAWMRSRWSLLFRRPLDRGMTWRGRRLLGDNKTVRGFLAMVPAAGTAFAGLGFARDLLPGWVAAGLWNLPVGSLFLLGCWAGFWFMAGELPNSFCKRRCGIAAGAAPACGWARVACLATDRLDSILALLIALSLVVPVPWVTWAWVLACGPAVHLAFSAMLYCAGVKARLA
jgi:hypothetical protein